MNLPDWVQRVARYMLEEGLVNTLKIAADLARRQHA